MTTNFFLAFFFRTWIKSLKIHLQEKSPTIDKLSESNSKRRNDFKRTQNYFHSDVFTAVVLLCLQKV